MLPLPVLLGLMHSSGSAVDAAISAASAAGAVVGGVAGTVGKRIIKASVSAGKNASKTTFTFINGGISAVKAANSESLNPKIERLSRPLDIIENSLSIPASFVMNQEIRLSSEVAETLSIIRGQNEINFLSNSIRYFIESHVGRTGIDRGISYALQYDMKAVTSHLKSNSGLRFPGYLLHQCTCLFHTIKEMNIFYDAILHGGNVREWTEDEVQREMKMLFGLNRDKKYIQGYIPFDLQIPVKRKLAAEEKERRSRLQSLFSSDIGDINDAAHDALFMLESELIANENLEYEVTKKISREPEQMLLIESP